MIRHDYRDQPITGATAAALDRYERALAASLAWRVGADAEIEAALALAPGFTMAHVLRCWRMLGGRDPAGARLARPLHAQASTLPANARERLHLAALAAAIDDDFPRCVAYLAQLLQDDPRDVLALQVAHAFDYLMADPHAMLARVAHVLRTWPEGRPGRHAVLAMQAFALEECGHYDAAHATALEALALEPLDARAQHAIAHVYEMTGRAEAGLRAMSDRRAFWAEGSTAAMHCWWHVALFHLELGRGSHALALLDRRIDAVASQALGDLIDAASLLWRLTLRGIDVGDRWQPLARAWAPHVEDAYCTFSDLHAMLAFVGAGDAEHAATLTSVLAQRQSLPTRYGVMTRALGLPACRALVAFGEQRYDAAIQGLAPLAGPGVRLGGSHAQRDVIHLTLREAIDRLRGRRPALRRAA
jgi:hypothetical protein